MELSGPSTASVSMHSIRASYLDRSIYSTGVAPAGPATKYHCAECVGGAFDGERERDAQVAWALVRIAFWMAVAGVMHWRGVYLAL